jgi:hypothetical protein
MASNKTAVFGIYHNADQAERVVERLREELDLPPFLTQTVKTQNPFKGELSHGVNA